MKEIILLLTALAFVSCAVCEEKTLEVVTSPNGDYVAHIYRRNCGATSGFVYHVNIRKKGSWFSSDHRGVIEEGQVFLSDVGKINISWKDNKTMLIQCDACARERWPITKDSWNDVTISYQLQ
jgi:hypothetical protein